MWSGGPGEKGYTEPFGGGVLAVGGCVADGGREAVGRRASAGGGSALGRCWSRLLAGS